MVYVNVNAGVTLTIEPGTVVKFRNTGALLQVSGDLIAQGAPGDTIVFTSYNDDFYGGDTNGDGDSSEPSPGQWTQIVIRDGDAIDMSYCRDPLRGLSLQHGWWLSQLCLTCAKSQAELEPQYHRADLLPFWQLLWRPVHRRWCQPADGKTAPLWTASIAGSLRMRSTASWCGSASCATMVSEIKSVPTTVRLWTPSSRDNTRDGGYGIVCSGTELYASNTVFRGNNYGIYMQVTDLELDNCVIRNCATRGIELRSPTTLVMHDSRIDSCGTSAWAININGGTLDWDSFVDNEIVDNEWWTLQVPLARLDQLITTNLIAGNGNSNALYVQGDTFPTGTTRLTNAFAYCFDGTFTVSQGDSLILDPGLC